MVNLAFDGSPTDPEATQSTTTMQQAITASSSASKPLLYFIHGAGESSESWRRVMQFFSGRQYEVLALDLLGHGFSGTPRSGKCYTFAKLLGDVAAVFDAHVSEGRKAVLIGHGYGCSLAVALSRQRSSNVALLALLSSGGPTPLAPPISSRGREWKLPRSLLRCLKSLLPCGIRRAVFYGARGKSCIHENGPLQSLPSYVRHHLGAGQSWPEGDVAFHRKVSVPTLLVHGLKDRFVSLVEMCEMERVKFEVFLLSLIVINQQFSHADDPSGLPGSHPGIRSRDPGGRSGRALQDAPQIRGALAALNLLPEIFLVRLFLSCRSDE